MALLIDILKIGGGKDVKNISINGYGDYFIQKSNLHSLNLLYIWRYPLLNFREWHIIWGPYIKKI